MTKVTNLNRARKQKAREMRKRSGDENAVKFGRTKAQKSLEEATAQQARRKLDGHRKE